MKRLKSKLFDNSDFLNNIYVCFNYKHVYPFKARALWSSTQNVTYYKLLEIINYVKFRCYICNLTEDEIIDRLPYSNLLTLKQVEVKNNERF
jgi:hypothetical protein